MSQLDVSISFSQLGGLLLCFYFFVHYSTACLVNFWYNWKLRALNTKVHTIQPAKKGCVALIQQLLKA